MFFALTAGAGVLGFLLTPVEAARAAESAAGGELSRLLKGMAVIKLTLVLPALGAIAWRLGLPASQGRLAAYAGAGMAMALSIGLIWHLVNVGAGAVLMHLGFIMALVLLFTDKAVTRRLDQVLKSRAFSRKA